MRIEYNKRSGPVTAHEVVALDFLAACSLLPCNPLTPSQLHVTLSELPLALRTRLLEDLLGSSDEGAGVLEALDVVIH